MRSQPNFKDLRRESSTKKDFGEKQPAKRNEGAVAELPVLYFGSKNNFIKFKEKLSIYVHAKFGALGTIIDMGRDIVVQEVELPAMDNAFDAEHDPFGFARQTFNAKIATREKLFSKFQQDRIGLFFTIYGQLSEESKSKVHEDEDWEEIYGQKDPMRLWIVVGATHQGGATGIPVLDLSLIHI